MLPLFFYQILFKLNNRDKGINSNINTMKTRNKIDSRKQFQHGTQ